MVRCRGQAVDRRAARARFETVESSVRYQERSVYDLEGEFELAFMGWVLQTLDDPIGAFKAVRRIASQLLLLDTVSLPLSLLPSPLARLDARRDGGGILRERYAGATGWKHRLGIRGRSYAMLAS